MKRDPSKSYTLLDIGAGGCDIPVRLIRHVRRNGLHLKITAVDYDERIVEYSRQLLKDYPEIEVVSDSLENLSGYKKFDYVISNNVLHHFEWKDMTGLLSVLGKVTKRMFIMNDIHRSNFGYFFYSVFAGLFLKNSFAFYDGRLSIKKGFVKNELSVIMDGIGYEFPVRVEYVIPERVVIIGDMN
jgi:2-polyprenyl-3-methyl-5-hydroxy-6-metoxy-1,4-benzoquinol methylase